MSAAFTQKTQTQPQRAAESDLTSLTEYLSAVLWIVVVLR